MLMALVTDLGDDDDDDVGDDGDDAGDDGAGDDDDDDDDDRHSPYLPPSFHPPPPPPALPFLGCFTWGHSPRLMTRSSSPVLHASTSMAHSFGYVSPSDAHTGASSSGHTSWHSQRATPSTTRHTCFGWLHTDRSHGSTRPGNGGGEGRGKPQVTDQFTNTRQSP